MKIISNSKWIRSKSYQKRILLDNINGKINLVEDVIVDPKGIIPMHKHVVTDEIFYITVNSATMVINGKKHKVHAGDMIYVDSGTEHGFVNKSDNEFKMIVFKINFKKGDSYIK